MKLRFLQPYPSSSITEKFDDIELKDFTIITGKNGVGKTHLLEAIVDPNNYIDIDNNISTIYFNYNDFVVENRDNKQQTLKKKYNNLPEIEQDLKNIIQFVDNINQKLQQTFPNKDQLISNVYNYLINKVSFLDTPSWDSIRSELLQFSTDEVLLKQIYDEYKKYLSLLLEQKDKNFDKYYNKSNQIGIPLIYLNISHFQYSESWLGQLLDSEFKNYIQQYGNKENNLKLSLSQDTSLEQLKKKTIEAIGHPPWRLLNEILGEYSCNGYIINDDFVNRIGLFQDISKNPLYITLKNTITNQIINLGRLSSGEQTLFALAFSIYRQRKDNNLPDLLLLDEIDSSLHPSMCRQLLNVLENIFVKKYKLKIIMVTHSPSTVALAPDESIYVMENNKGKISLKNKSKQEAIKFLSDGFATFDDGLNFLDNLMSSDEKIIILTEGNNTNYIKKAIKLIEPNLLKDIKIIKAIKNQSGKAQLEKLFNLVSTFSRSQNIFFIWDCDANEYRKLKKQNNVTPYVFEKNNNNDIAKDGIENLFCSNLFDGFCSEFKKSNRPTQIEFDKDRKNDFWQFIEKKNNKDDFKNFQPLINELKSYL